jgi:replicative DNA helicase
VANWGEHKKGGPRCQRNPTQTLTKVENHCSTATPVGPTFRPVRGVRGEHTAVGVRVGGPAMSVNGNGQPPQDQQAEQAVLGGMLLSRTAIPEVLKRLAPADFYQPAHQNLYDAILRLHGRGEPADAVTVAAELDRRRSLKRIGGAPYLHTLTAAPPNPASAGYYAKIVADKALMRRLVDTGTRITQLGYAGDDDAADVIRRAQAELSAATKRADGAEPGDHAIDGAAFILDQPTSIPARWGDGTSVLWPEGEALMIAGPQGLCKTTLAGLLVRAQLGIGNTVLGLPVQDLGCRILYLAMDRPRQIARSLHRQFSEADRAVLAERLVILPGPPPADLAAQPTLLAALADRYGAEVVYVDSLKDAALRLSADEVGAAYNRARQHLLQQGADLCELHHTVKRGPDGAAPKSIADIYGSAWLTNGCGSVILLSGEPGDPIIASSTSNSRPGRLAPGGCCPTRHPGN